MATTLPLPQLTGTYLQRIAYSASLLSPGQVWYQTDSEISTPAPAGYYTWGGTWTYEATQAGQGIDINGDGQNLGSGGSLRINNSVNSTTLIASNPNGVRAFLGLWGRAKTAASIIYGVFFSQSGETTIRSADNQVVGLWSTSPTTGASTRLLDLKLDTSNNNKISASLRYGSSDSNYGQPVVTAYAEIPDIANSGSGENDAATYALGANSLVGSVAGKQGIDIFCWGTTAANANNKRARITFGATTIADSGSLSLNNKVWSIQARVFRTGAAAQYAHGVFMVDGTASIQTNSTPAETLTGAVNVTFKITGAASNDIALKGWRIDVIN